MLAGKDMLRPINASKKQRNCHIKLMVVDEEVGIQGNGNQGSSEPGPPHTSNPRCADSQSWFHSQEANILIDSEIICKDWLEAAYSNQNTHLYGKVDADGIWRDPKDGTQIESTALEGGALGALKGMRDTFRRATGSK
jgi:hypothetical protein